jgi:hypothetical protein
VFSETPDESLGSLTSPLGLTSRRCPMKLLYGTAIELLPSSRLGDEGSGLEHLCYIHSECAKAHFVIKRITNSLGTTITNFKQRTLIGFTDYHTMRTSE